jgi:phosphomannomutase
MTDRSVFRAYDIRGIVGETITAGFAHRLGLAYAQMLRKRSLSSVAVGYDGRLHSPMLAEALRRGFSEGGINVLNIGVGPTPMTYFGTHKTGASSAIMVTGSHNPPEYNGFKCVVDQHPFYGDDLLALHDVMEKATPTPQQGAITSVSLQGDYVQALLMATHLHRLPTSLTCVWDPGNGAAGDVIRALVAQLPGKHILINDAIDGTFPAHHPDPSDAHNMVQLQQAVLAHKADVGLAFDGDGDRLGVVDDQGKILGSDALLTLLARNVLADHPGATLLGDVKTSRLFFDDVKKNGGHPIIWMVGHAHMKAKMKTSCALFAGEGSGHIFFADRYFGYDDALYAALRTLETLAGGPLSAQIAALPPSHASPEVRVFCPDDQKFTIIDILRQHIESKRLSCLTIDGIRVETPQGWWLARASNTQPALSVRCESMTAGGLPALVKALITQLQDVGLAVQGEDFLPKS